MFCICNGPERRPMIGCDTCDGWFHFNCVGISKNSVLPEKWYCPKCRSNNMVELHHTLNGLKEAITNGMKEGFLLIKQNQQQVLNELNEELRLQISSLTKAFKQQEDGYKDAIDKLQQEKTDLNMTVESLQKEMKDKFIKDQRQANTALGLDENERLMNEELRSKIESLTKAFKQQVEGHKSAIEKLQQEKTDLNITVEYLQKEMKDKLIKDQLQANTALGLDENERLMNEELRSKIESLTKAFEQQVEGHKGAIEKLQQENTDLNITVEYLQKEMKDKFIKDQLQANTALGLDENERLMNEELRSNIESLTKAFEQQVEGHKEAIGKLQQENTDLSKTVRGLQTDKDKLVQEVSSLKKRRKLSLQK